MDLIKTSQKVWRMNYLGNFYMQLYHLQGKLIHEDNNKELKSLYDITYNTQQKQQKHTCV
jgi:hypothetical protein